MQKLETEQRLWNTDVTIHKSWCPWLFEGLKRVLTSPAEEQILCIVNFYCDLDFVLSTSRCPSQGLQEGHQLGVETSVGFVKVVASAVGVLGLDARFCPCHPWVRVDWSLYCPSKHKSKKKGNSAVNSQQSFNALKKFMQLLSSKIWRIFLGWIMCHSGTAHPILLAWCTGQYIVQYPAYKSQHNDLLSFILFFCFTLTLCLSKQH